MNTLNTIGNIFYDYQVCDGVSDGSDPLILPTSTHELNLIYVILYIFQAILMR